MPSLDEYIENPSLEQCKMIMFRYVKADKKIKKIYKKYDDLVFTGKHELINYEYYQIWKSEKQNQIYIAYCDDMRYSNSEKIWKGLS